MQTTWRKGGKGRFWAPDGCRWCRPCQSQESSVSFPLLTLPSPLLYSRSPGSPSIGSCSKSIRLLGRLVLVDQVIDAIIGGSVCSLPWCSMSGPPQAISPGCCPGIVELALPELVSPMQVPARTVVSVECDHTKTQPHGSDHAPPGFLQSNVHEK